MTIKSNLTLLGMLRRYLFNRMIIETKLTAFNRLKFSTQKRINISNNQGKLSKTRDWRGIRWLQVTKVSLLEPVYFLQLVKSGIP